jgi:amino acid permease
MAEKISNRDIDLQKIQVLDNNFQSLFNFMCSIASGGLIAVIVLIATIYYTTPAIQNANNFTVYIIINSTVFLIFLFILKYLRNQRIKHLREISTLVDRIENGYTLPSINELRKQSQDPLMVIE